MEQKSLFTIAKDRWATWENVLGFIFYTVFLLVLGLLIPAVVIPVSKVVNLHLSPEEVTNMSIGFMIVLVVIAAGTSTAALVLFGHMYEKNNPKEEKPNNPR